LEREAKLASAPSAKKPAKTHIPAVPVPGIHYAVIRPAEASTYTMISG
jgi:hypothetical protein